MRGGDIYRLKEVLGHADIQTTMIYAHLRPEALRQEMEKCFGAGRTPIYAEAGFVARPVPQPVATYSI